MRDTIDILGVKIDRITSAYALKKAEQMVRSRWGFNYFLLPILR